jgi:hypothetical protein
MSNVVDEYKDIERKDEVTRGVRKLRRKFFRYKEAEYVYSIEHKKLLELADKAGAIYRVDGFVLIEREIFERFLETFHQPPRMTKTGGRKK